MSHRWEIYESPFVDLQNAFFKHAFYLHTIPQLPVKQVSIYEFFFISIISKTKVDYGSTKQRYIQLQYDGSSKLPCAPFEHKGLFCRLHTKNVGFESGLIQGEQSQPIKRPKTPAMKRKMYPK